MEVEFQFQSHTNSQQIGQQELFIIQPQSKNFKNENLIFFCVN